MKINQQLKAKFASTKFAKEGGSVRTEEVTGYYKKRQFCMNSKCYGSKNPLYLNPYIPEDLNAYDSVGDTRNGQNVRWNKSSDNHWKKI